MKITVKGAYAFRQLGQRSNQEDSCWPETPQAADRVFVVCDGVGGIDKGEVASSCVCQTLAAFFRDKDFTEHSLDMGDFEKALHQVYDEIEKADPAHKGMGTTLTFACVNTGGVFLAHIGDSRIYQLRKDEGVVFQTEDHSLVQELVNAGIITEEQAKTHPRKNVITRAIVAVGDGERDNATIDIIKKVKPGDVFLLCSDGVSGTLDNQQLVEVLTADDTLENRVKQLANQCREAHDNNTAIVFEIGDVEADEEADEEQLPELEIQENIPPEMPQNAESILEKMAKWVRNQFNR